MLTQELFESICVLKTISFLFFLRDDFKKGLVLQLAPSSAVNLRGSLGIL